MISVSRFNPESGHPDAVQARKEAEVAAKEQAAKEAAEKDNVKE